MDNAKLGRTLLIGMNAATALNGIIADFNRTHLFNKKWPPHSKFHDGMGLTLGAFLGGLGLFALFRKRGRPADNLRLAALCPAAFFAAMLSAYAYPGADSIDAEFPNYWPKLGKFSFNEGPLALTMLLITAAGWRLAEPEATDMAAPLRHAIVTADVAAEPAAV